MNIQHKPNAPDFIYRYRVSSAYPYDMSRNQYLRNARRQWFDEEELKTRYSGLRVFLVRKRKR